MSKEASGFITTTQLNNGFAALREDTRAQVLQELRKAAGDTAMDYHREKSRATQLKLHNEIEGIKVLIKSLELVTQEFTEINRVSK